METLNATTSRAITFSNDAGGFGRKFPEGTAVYARPRRDGKGLNIRVAGTLFVQHVYPQDIVIA